MNKITIKQAIELGLTTTEQLTKDATAWKLSKVNDLHATSLCNQITNQFSDGVKELCYFWAGYRVNINLRDHTKLHELRVELRKSLGSWTDKLDNYYINGSNELQATYQATMDNLPCEVIISVDYHLDEIPAGLMKPECKIVQQTTNVVECKLS